MPQQQLLLVPQNTLYVSDSQQTQLAQYQGQAQLI